MSNYLSWINSIREKTVMNVTNIPFRESKEWKFDEESTRLFRHLGGFFSIIGIKAYYSESIPVEVALIDQPEIGILGFILREKNNQPEVLFQAKSEPGNVGICQLAPTVQATESNYKQLHKGSAQPYVEYFLNPVQTNILHSSLQTEQGWKFWRKRNLNTIIKGDVEALGGYKWISLKDVSKLLSQPHLLNSDSRSVLCSLFLTHPQFFTVDKQFKDCINKSIEEVNETSLEWVMKQQQKFSNTHIVPLKELQNWIITESEISQNDSQLHRIIQIKVETNAREISSWDQPIIDTYEEEEITLVGKMRDGQLELLVQCVSEPGLWLQKGISATFHQSPVKTLNDNSTYIKEWLHAGKDLWVREKVVKNSEEGGRFYKDENIHSLIIVDEHFPEITLPDNYMWMTLGDIRALLTKEYILTNELRSVLCLLFSE